MSSTKKTVTRKKKTSSRKNKSTKKISRPMSSKKKGLIIVESPAKARTIQKFSDNSYMVKASMGHVRDLPKTTLGVKVEQDYEPRYITIRGKKDVLDELRKGVKKVKNVYLASDPDREGEAIAWHLSKLLKVDNPYRIEMHEITKKAFKEAITNPREIDMKLVNAQQARRILDRLVGYKLSPLLWKKIRAGLSAGRVQSVAVKLICDRQKEIDQFEPEEYWSIDVLTSKLNKPKKEAFKSSLLKKNNKKIKIPDKKKADEILSEIKQNDFVVSNIKKTEQKKNPAPPFKTSTLQQQAFKSLNFPARKTMTIAQQLYEGIDIGKAETTGLITYMRTDSVRISKAAQTEADEFITGEFGEEFKSGGRKYKSSAHAQEAHEAIRPTSVFRTPDKMSKFLDRNQLKLYRMIWTRFVASQMASAIIENTSVDIKCGPYLFRAKDSKVKFKGYLAVYEDSKTKSKTQSKEREELLPPLEVGEKLTVHEYLPDQHFTQPPPPYTEASLIKALEEKGIGRPSTFAPIVNTIQKRGYVEIVEKKFRPTELGITVTNLLEEYFADILNVDFTAEMESRLDLIEEGKKEWVEVVDNFYRPFVKDLEEAEEKIPRVELKPEPAGFNCEKCGKPMVIKRGRYGKFIACSGYPDCKNTKPFLNKIGVPCPEEGCNGEIIEKKSKKGKFFGCSNYPECKFASWNKPINERCDRCGKIRVLRFSKNGKPYKACIDSKCRKK